MQEINNLPTDLHSLDRGSFLTKWKLLIAPGQPYANEEFMKHVLTDINPSGAICMQIRLAISKCHPQWTKEHEETLRATRIGTPQNPRPLQSPRIPPKPTLTILSGLAVPQTMVPTMCHTVPTGNSFGTMLHLTKEASLKTADPQAPEWIRKKNPIDRAGMRAATGQTLRMVRVLHIMTILTLIPHTTGMTGDERKLKFPGDTLTVGGLKINLHRTQSGVNMISIKTSLPATSYGHETHQYEYTKATKIEKKLDNLLHEIEKGTPPGGERKPIKPIRSSMGTTKQACDCHLAHNPWDWNIQNHPPNGYWVANHLETSDIGCPTTKGQDSYDIAMAVTRETPTCTISPSPLVAFTLITPLIEMTTPDAMEQTNKGVSMECITKGAYDLQAIHEDKYRAMDADTLIECQLQCRFSEKCTQWMFEDGNESNPRKYCWSIHLEEKMGKYMPNQNGTSYTGRKGCLPCPLNKIITILKQGKWETINEKCLYTAQGFPSSKLSCPCQNRMTYRNLKEEVTRVHLRAQSNAITLPCKSKGKHELAAEVARIIRNLSPNNKDNRRLRTLLTGGSILAKAAMQITGWGNPEYFPTIDNLEPVKKIKALLDPAYKILTELVTTKAMNSDHIPDSDSTDLSTTNTSNNNTYNTHKNFDNFFNGSLQTTSDITNTLQEVDNFLEEISMEKNYQLVHPRSMTGIPRPSRWLPNNSNTLILTADEGDKLSRIAIFPIQEQSNMIQLTTIPVPSWVTAEMHEKDLPLGTTEFNTEGFLSNTHRSSSIKCLMQIAEGLEYPKACDTTYRNRQLKEISVIPVRDELSTYRLLRLARPNIDPETLKISCGRHPRFITILGITTILVGPTCQIRDGQGNIISDTWGSQSSPNLTEGFAVLYNAHLSISNIPRDIDYTHHAILTLLLIIVLILSTDRIRSCYKERQADSSRTTIQGMFQRYSLPDDHPLPGIEEDREDSPIPLRDRSNRAYP